MIPSTGDFQSVLIEIAQNHPLNDFPSFFVHPCYTTEAMRELLGTQVKSPIEYLMIWLGLVGSCVGLHMPKDLAFAIAEESEPNRERSD